MYSFLGPDLKSKRNSRESLNVYSWTKYYVEVYLQTFTMSSFHTQVGSGVIALTGH